MTEMKDIRPEDFNCPLAFITEYFKDNADVRIGKRGKRLRFEFDSDASSKEFDELLDIWDRYTKTKFNQE